MAGFRNVTQFALAESEGRTVSGWFRKTPSQGSAASFWVDLSMAAGAPVPQYYASSPLEAATLSGMKGLFHGTDKTPYTKYLTDWNLVTSGTAFVGRCELLDYLLYYPLVDGDSLDTQVLVNDVLIPRYTDGAGVQVMAVCSAPTTGGGSFTFDYIDDRGITCTSPAIACATVAINIATLMTSQPGAGATNGTMFCRLAEGSKGVRQILSVTNISAIGGLFALVLVKPLATSCIREINTAVEKNFVSAQAGCPRILDGSYLGMIFSPITSVAGNVLTGYLKFAWGTD